MTNVVLHFSDFDKKNVWDYSYLQQFYTHLFGGTI